MNVIIQLISAIILLIGLGYMLSAFFGPGQYYLPRLSAVQVTQVYAEAIYNAAIATMCFVVVILLQVLIQQRSNKEMQALVENTKQTNQLLKRLGGSLQSAANGSVQRAGISGVWAGPRYPGN